MSNISMDVHRLKVSEFERLSDALRDVRQYGCSIYKEGTYYMSATLDVGEELRIRVYSLGYAVKFDTLNGQPIEDCTEES